MTLRAQLVRYTVVGAASSLGYLALYAALRTGLSPLVANPVALVATSVLSTAANRRFTFGLAGPRQRTRQHAEALLVFLAGLALTSAALATTRFDSPALELGVLSLAKVGGGLLRFTLFRIWIFATKENSAMGKGNSDPKAIVRELIRKGKVKNPCCRDTPRCRRCPVTALKMAKAEAA